MDIFGTVAAAIDLGLKLKAAFEQVGQNRSDAFAFSGEIVESLLRIQDFLKEQPSPPSDQLRDDLSEFENQLGIILRRQNSLNKRMTEVSTSKFKEFYNAGDIKNELTELRQKIQECRQNLQLSCTIRIDSGVTTTNEQILLLRKEQEAADRKLQKILDALVPASTPQRRRTLDRIQENMQERISVIDTDGALEQDLYKLQRAKEVALSVKSAKGSLKSLSASLIEKKYLIGKVKELGGTIPHLRNQASKGKVGTLLNPFRGLAARKSYSTINASREASIRETLRILTILRSDEMVPPINAVRDLLGLARALGSLGMEAEANDINDWAVQICRDLAEAGKMGTLFDLAKFFHKLFMQLSSCGESEAAQRVLSHAVQVRCQLDDRDQKTYLTRLASYVETVSSKLKNLKHLDAASNTMEEFVAIQRSLMKRDRGTYLPLLSRSLFDFANDLGHLGRYDDAVKTGEEAIEIRRELVKINRNTYLPGLAYSLYNVAVHLGKLGQYDDAVKTGEEAVEIRRELVKINRNTYLPDLASSLYNVAVHLGDLGRYDDAVERGREAVEIRRELVKINRNTYLPGLASSLNNLGFHLEKLGRYADAVEPDQEALEICRELVKVDRNTYLPNLACTLDTSVILLWALGRHDDAVKAEQETIEMYRELVESNPDNLEYSHDLTQCQERLSKYMEGRSME